MTSTKAACNQMCKKIIFILQRPWYVLDNTSQLKYFGNLASTDVNFCKIIGINSPLYIFFKFTVNSCRVKILVFIALITKWKTKQNNFTEIDTKWNASNIAYTSTNTFQ